MALMELGRQWTREALRETMRQAQYAQSLRAEQATGGNKTEAKSFYRSGNAPLMNESEVRLTVAAADREHRRMRGYDADQAAAHVPMSNDEWESISRQAAADGW